LLFIIIIISIYIALLRPLPGPLPSTFLGSNALCRQKCPTRKRPVCSVYLQLPFPPRPCLLFVYLLGRPCRTGTLLLLGCHPLGLQSYLILTDLKPLLTEGRPLPALLLKLLLLTRLSLGASSSQSLLYQHSYRNCCW
jgi:hypothetical protein